MKRFICLLLFVILTCLACNTTQAIKQSRGKGFIKHYKGSYEEIYNITLKTIKDQNLHLEEFDKDTGFIYVTHGMTAWSWGERIAIFVTKIDDDKTGVEIVNRKVLVPLNFAPDWAKYIFVGIEAELQAKK